MPEAAVVMTIAAFIGDVERRATGILSAPSAGAATSAASSGAFSPRRIARSVARCLANVAYRRHHGNVSQPTFSVTPARLACSVRLERFLPAALVARPPEICTEIA